MYKKVELGSLISKNKIKEELDADIELEWMTTVEMKTHRKS